MSQAPVFENLLSSIFNGDKEKIAGFIAVHITNNTQDRLEIKKKFFNGECIVDISAIPQDGEA